MPNIHCPTCNKVIMDYYHDIVLGCQHIPRDTIVEMSNEQMSDGMTKLEANRKAIELYLASIEKQRELF